jgi:CRP/FNR family cyclic AMP-dependent transcriptional regulator
VTKDALDSLSGMVPGSIAGSGVGARPRADRRSDHLIGKRHTDVLAQVPLFAGLPRRHLKKLAERADEVTFDPGSHIVEVNDPGSAFFVLVAGEAKVVRNGRTLGHLQPGDFFGEISLLDGGPRTASVIAETPVDAVRIFKKTFDELLSEEPGVASQILVVLARRLREAERPLHA